MKTVIIGGVAAGGSAAARLRRLDENCQILLLEKVAGAAIFRGILRLFRRKNPFG